MVDSLNFKYLACRLLHVVQGDLDFQRVLVGPKIETSNNFLIEINNHLFTGIPLGPELPGRPGRPLIPIIPGVPKYQRKILVNHANIYINLPGRPAKPGFPSRPGYPTEPGRPDTPSRPRSPGGPRTAVTPYAEIEKKE